MKDFYSINELAVMTGFTTRSLRNFIQMEFLKGEKVNGEWKFSTEQIENFFVTIHHKKLKKNRHYPLFKEIQM